ncbi:MAG: YfhO family protein [Verrucomicrobiota bacterium]
MNFSKQAIGQTLCYIIVLLVIFAKPIFGPETLYSLDSPPYYRDGYSGQMWQAYQGYWNDAGLGAPSHTFFHPHRLLLLVMPPTFYHNFVYLFDTALLALALVFFLRGRGITGWAALAGALGLSFSGYTFTLISAGHRVTFDMMPYAVFMLGFIDRGIRNRSPYQLAMAGLCAGIGMSSGSPDKQILFCVLGGLYALVLLIREKPKDSLPRLGLGIALAGALLAAMSAGTYTFLFSEGEVVERREQMRGNTKEQKWIYATNWSLPPSGALEFIAPCVFGWETTAPEQIGATPIAGFVPYWGKLGMPQGWEKQFNEVKKAADNPNLNDQQRQQVQTILNQTAARLNYRQHTVYLGVLPVAFALFACLYYLGPARWSGRDDADNARRWFVTFWLVALILCIGFSFGRHTGLYKIIYSLPVLNKIRAPVKFVHLVEVCLNILFAVGMAAWIKLLIQRSKEGAAEGGRKVLLIAGSICLGLGIVMLLCLLIYGSTTSPMADYWRQIGRGALASSLANQMAAAFGHAFTFFLIAGAMFMIPWKSSKSWMAGALPVVVITALAIDLIIVDKRYMRTKDLTNWYAANEIATQIKSDGLHRASYQMGAPQKHDWRWFNFFHHNTPLLERPANQRVNAQETAVAQALQRNGIRYWQITATDRILASAQMASRLRIPSMEPIRHFRATNGRYRFTDDTNGTSVLFNFKDALPRAQLYYQWEPLDEAATLKRLAEPGWNPKQSVLVPADSDAPQAGTTGTEPATITAYEPNRIILKVDAKAEGILLLNDAFHKAWSAQVDGQDAAILRANHIMRGVRVPAGSHEIRFEYQRPIASLNGFRISSAALLVMIGASLFHGFRPLKRPKAKTGTDPES